MANETRLERERDLYLRLLELGHNEALAPLLEDALALVVGVTSADRGYIELYTNSSGDPEWSIARGCSEEDVAQIRVVTSRGIVAEAIATGTTIHTPSALLDPRFSHQPSVRRQGIEAVLCTPLGGTPPIGVLYLQRPPGTGPFEDADVVLAERFARHIAPLVTRLLISDRTARDEDQTKIWRERVSARGLIGRSRALARVLQQVTVVAPLNFDILIHGPTGSGKTQLARIIHENSPRRSKPFLEVNCGAIVDTLAISEMFGSAKGGHSAASERIPGKVDQANGGTLFLDDVTSLQSAGQAALLQFLESRLYSAIGGAQTRADVRIISASNEDLDEVVRAKRFREDLRFRLEVAEIRMPALVERREDIVLLAEHFVDAIASTQGVPHLGFSPTARLAIDRYEWPGNIRELEKHVIRGVIAAVGESSSQIEAHHLFPGAENPLTGGPSPTYQQQMSVFQKQVIASALADSGWNVLETSRRLDMSRAHLYELIKIHKLERNR